MDSLFYHPITSGQKENALDGFELLEAFEAQHKDSKFSFTDADFLGMTSIFDECKQTVDAELTQMISTLDTFLIHHTNEDLLKLTPATLKNNLTTTLNAIETHVKTIQANGGLGDVQWNSIDSCITQYPSNGNTLNTLKQNFKSRSRQGNSRLVDRFGHNGGLVDDIIKTLEQLKPSKS